MVGDSRRRTASSRGGKAQESAKKRRSDEHEPDASRASAKKQSSSSRRQGMDMSLAEDGPRSTQQHKRSLFTSQDDDFQMPSSRREARDAFLTRTLRLAGLRLSATKTDHLLTLDQSLFLKNMNKHFSSISDSEMDTFMQELETFLSDDDNLKQSLKPTKTTLSGGPASRVTQESLLRLLLNIEKLQPRLVEIVLDKLGEIACDEESCDIRTVKLILKQLVRLNTIVEGKALAEKVYELVQNTPVMMQQELISCLPDVMSDEHHRHIAVELSSMLGDNFLLTGSILDTLNHLTIPREDLDTIRHKVVTTLPSFRLEEVHMAVDFALSSLKPDDPIEVACVVRDLRINLDFEPHALGERATQKVKALAAARSQQAKSPEAGCSFSQGFEESSGGGEGGEAIAVEVIRKAFLNKKFIGDAWLKVIDSVKVPEDHRTSDIILLIVLKECSMWNDLVDRLLRSKVRAGLFSYSLLKSAFEFHKETMQNCYETILMMAQGLIRSNERMISYFACYLYKLCISSWTGNRRGEAVLDLINMVVQEQAKRNVALRVLQNVAKNRVERVQEHAVHVMGILYHLDTLDLEQARMLMDILARITFTGNSSRTGLQNEVIMVIEKQMCSDKSKFSMMGVLGALLAARSIADTHTKEFDEAATATPQAEGRSYHQASVYTGPVKTAFRLLEVIKKNAGSSPETLGLFLDESATMIQQNDLHPLLVNWICETIADDFEDAYLCKLKAKRLSDDGYLPVGPWHNLNYGTYEARAINIAPLIFKQMDRKGCASGMQNPYIMCSTLRLVRAKEMKQRSKLDAVEGLMSYPLVMPDKEVVTAEGFRELAEDKQRRVVVCLLVALNWHRELVNCFAKHVDMSKVMTRLRQVVELQDLLTKCLPYVGPQVLPQMQFYWDRSEHEGGCAALQKSVKGGRKKKSSGKGGKGKGKGKSTTQRVITQPSPTSGVSPTSGRSQQPTTQDEVASVHGQSKQRVGEIGAAALVPFLREMDLVVFDLLNEMLCPESLSEDDLLVPEVLLFLLEDLKRKLDHCLVAHDGKKAAPVRGRSGSTGRSIGFTHLTSNYTEEEVARQCINLLPSLCTHLEKVFKYFQNLIESNDGMLDAFAMLTEEAARMGSCFSLLFQTINSVLGWHDLHSKSNTRLLRTALSKMALRINQSGSQLVTVSGLVPEAFQYLAGFQECVLRLDTAVAHLKLLETVAKLRPSDQLHSDLGECANKYLKHRWLDDAGNVLQGTAFNRGVDFFLGVYLTHCSELPVVLAKLLQGPVAEVAAVRGKREYASEEYPTLSKQSIGVYHKAIFSALVGAVKKLATGSDDLSEDDRMDGWVTYTKIFNQVTGVYEQDMLNKTIAYSTFTLSNAFVQKYKEYAIPFLKGILKSRKDTVENHLREVQTSTRFLQKAIFRWKEGELGGGRVLNVVPSLRKVLEELVQAVKRMYRDNGWGEALYMGNLNLKGKSKRRRQEEEEEEEEETEAERDNEEQQQEEEEDGSSGRGSEDEEEPTEADGESEEDIDLPTEDNSDAADGESDDDTDDESEEDGSSGRGSDDEEEPTEADGESEEDIDLPTEDNSDAADGESDDDTDDESVSGKGCRRSYSKVY